MGGWPRAAIVVVLILLAASSTAGCIAKKDDDREEVLRAWSRDTPTDPTSEVTFNIPQGLDRMRFQVSTKPPKQESGGWDWSDYCPAGTPGCPTTTKETPKGTVTVTLWDPNNVQQARILLNYDSVDEQVIPQPASGRWFAKISYGGYEGPVRLMATEPVQTSRSLGDDFWDILGVVLTIGAATVGWVLYRRRREFLSRQLDRIDHTFRDLSDDVVECRQNLLDMKRQLGAMLMRRKLEESQFLILEKRIDQYLADLDTPGNRHAPPAPDKGSAGLERFRRSNG